MRKIKTIVLLGFTIVFFTACGGGGDDSSDTISAPLEINLIGTWDSKKELESKEEKGTEYKPSVGFKDIKWGSNLSNISGFTISKSNKYGKDYSHKYKILKLFGVSMDTVLYRTHQDKFYLFSGKFKEAKNYNLLLTILKEKHGQPSNFNKDLKQENTSWDIYTSIENNKKKLVRITIKINYLTQLGEIIFLNIKHRPKLISF